VNFEWDVSWRLSNLNLLGTLLQSKLTKQFGFKKYIKIKIKKKWLKMLNLTNIIFKQYTTGLTSGQKQQWEKLQWELLRQDEL